MAERSFMSQKKSTSTVSSTSRGIVSSSSKEIGTEKSINNGHGFHENCSCNKCSQRKVEKHMLQEYNDKLLKMMTERDRKIKKLQAVIEALKESKESYHSETIKEETICMQETIKQQDVEIKNLRMNLQNKDVEMSRLKNEIEEQKIILERNSTELRKMRTIEEELFNLRASKKHDADRIKSLEEKMRREKDNSSSHINNINKLFSRIEQKVDEKFGKYDDGKISDDLKKALDDLRKTYISKVEFDRKVHSIKKEYEKYKQNYEDEMIKNVELNRVNGKYSAEIKQLRTEMERLRRELEDFLQQNQDVNGVLQSEITKYKQMESKYNDLLALERCQDCVQLREEIDYYGCLIQGKIPQAKDQTSPPSSSSSSDSEAESSKKYSSNYRVHSQAMQRTIISSSGGGGVSQL